MPEKVQQLLHLATVCLFASLCIAQGGNPLLYGRYVPVYPAGRCCSGRECLDQDRGRYAFVTSLRTSEYMTGLRELHCSLQRTNPAFKLIVIGVEGDLTLHEIQHIRSFAEYRIVGDIKVGNLREPRYGLNWMKLRAWQFAEFDAVIMLDCDIVVREDLTHLFSLPTDFAWASYQGHTGWNYNSGGFVFFRPCQATFDSMMHFLQSDSTLHFLKEFAEQSFLSWYFKYTAFDLPMKYNLNSNYLTTEGLTPGGDEPAVIHFVNKPFAARPGDAEWPYLCWQPQQLLGPRRGANVTAKERMQS